NEVLRRAVGPRAHEVGTRERLRLIGAAQIRLMTAGAVREIRRATGRGLLCRERSALGVSQRRGRAESGYESCAREDCHGSNQPQRLPSGALALAICT